MGELILPDESYKIVGACFEVYNEMGCGFLEAVYQECLELEFESQGIPFVAKSPLLLQYKHKPLKARYEPDFICWNQVVVEIKASSTLADENSAQILNYLNATKLPLGILVNFGHYPKLQYKRIAFKPNPSLIHSRLLA
jgi:GxxExxY protein